MTAIEIEYLRLLLELRERARRYGDGIEDAVLACREEGASVRGIAEALGVGSSTIQTWTKHARQRRNAG